MLVHTLKGCAGTIGARRLHEELKSLELMIKSGEPYMPQYQLVEQEFDTALKDVVKLCHIENGNRGASDSYTLSLMELEPQLLELMKKVVMYDTEAEELLVQILRSCDESLKQVLEPARRKLQDFDFDAAEKILDGILDKVIYTASIEKDQTGIVD